ncbi:MAG: ParB/RepB/Spo0J family partition protein [Oscillospiraceae bacterium]|nr:ParB/RepB/Spo0J family partition protein [Oscillospiraceae bacterium]
MRNEKLKIGGQILLIPTDKISENPLRARMYYNDKKTDELIRSIGESGIIEPLSVCASKRGDYIIISGERRFRAAKQLGFKKLPCILLDSSPEKSVLTCLTNSLTQEPLNYFEIALSYEKLKEHFGLTYEQTAAKLGVDTNEVLSKVRLLQIPPKLRKTLIEYGLSQKYATILVRHSDEQKEVLLKRIIEDRLTLSKTKLISDEMLNPKEETKNTVQTYFKDINVFVNTIERTYETMKNSGINAEMVKSDGERSVTYRIQIPKSV